MADIFISYKREDKKDAALLAKKLEASGWDVWWDHDLLGGEDYDVRIAKELKAARCAIVIWSSLSVQSRNVKDEARIAVNRNILVPVSFDNSEPPIGFGMTHVIFFQSRNKITEEEFEKLRESISQKVEPGEAMPPPPPQPPSFLKKYGYYIGALVILAVSYFIYTSYHGGGQAKQNNLSSTTGTDTGSSYNSKPISDTQVKAKHEEKSSDTHRQEPTTPSNQPTDNNLLTEAEQLTNEFLNAMKTKNIDVIVSTGSVPYYFDNKILTSMDEVRSSFQTTMQAKGDKPFPEIKSIKVKKVGEWKKEGAINENDRILKNMNISDDDYYAGVLFDHDGLGIAFRLVNGKLKIAGLWD